MSPPVALIGLPGSGKPTVGRLVAGRAAAGFWDTGTGVEHVAGMPIPTIFATAGEARFREWEETAVRTAPDTRRGVLPPGGGAILSAATRALPAGRPVIHPEASADDLPDCRKALGGRPLLRRDPGAKPREPAATRGPLYRQVARITAPTRGGTALDAAEATPTAPVRSGDRGDSGW